jgi:hypothetical protein
MVGFTGVVILQVGGADSVIGAAAAPARPVGVYRWSVKRP